MAVFSEIWYGPDKGWKAFIDGNEVPHIRANYTLRAMKVPAGEHDIKFVFHPASYHTGEMLSLVFSLVIVLVLGYGLYMWLTTPPPVVAVSAETQTKSLKKPIGQKKKHK